jgi:uncharacterized integral membrane protein
MKKVKFIILLIVLFLIVAFIWYNQQPVSIKFFGKTSPEMPFIFVLLATLILGAILASIIDLGRMTRLQAENRRQKKIVKRLEQELAALRKLPVEEVEREIREAEEIEKTEEPE